MGIFKRRKGKPDSDDAGFDDFADDEYTGEDDFDDAESAGEDGAGQHVAGEHAAREDVAREGAGHEAPQDEARPARRHARDTADEPPSGPFDAAEAPEDELPRLDLGSVRIPVPDGAQLQVEMDPEGPLRAVHLVTQIGQFTISAFAAPRSGELWPEVSRELGEQLQQDGAAIRYDPGEWGEELVGSADQVALRFLGVDGPRWMLRGVVAGPPEHAEHAGTLLRDLVRYTVVVRGEQPLPVRSPLPVELPEELVAHIEQARADQAQA